MKFVLAALIMSILVATPGAAGEDRSPKSGLTELPPADDPLLSRPEPPCGLDNRLCETKPAGRQVRLGNTKAEKICITPFRRGVPRQVGDLLCELLLGNFIRAKLDQDALDRCVNTIKVQCNKKDCKVNCVNQAQVTADQGVYYIPNDFDCRNNRQARLAGRTAACTNGNIVYECVCFCPVAPPPRPPIIEP